MRVQDLISLLCKYPAGYDVRVPIPGSDKLSTYFSVREHRGKGFVWIEGWDFVSDFEKARKNEGEKSHD